MPVSSPLTITSYLSSFLAKLIYSCGPEASWLMTRSVSLRLFGVSSFANLERVLCPATLNPRTCDIVPIMAVHSVKSVVRANISLLNPAKYYIVARSLIT